MFNLNFTWCCSADKPFKNLEENSSSSIGIVEPNHNKSIITVFVPREDSDQSEHMAQFDPFVFFPHKKGLCPKLSKSSVQTGQLSRPT